MGLALAAGFGFPFLMVGAPHLIVEGTVGAECRSGGPLDCQRAIADARQAVLLSLGGVIAIVGLIVTVRRWQLEREANVRAQSAHERETSQAARGTVVDAISLLDSDSAPKRTAAVAILREHAIVPENAKDVPMILDVLAAHVRRPTLLSKRKQTRSGRESVVSRPKNRFAASSTQAIKSALEISVLTGHRVDFEGVVLRGLVAPNSDWRFADIDGVRFEGGDLSDAVFSSENDPRRRLRGVEFLGTKLTRACFDNSEILDVKFGLAPSEEASSGLPRPRILQTIQGAGFAGAFLSSVEFKIGLNRVKFEGATLRNVIFDGQLMRSVNFDDSKLADVRFEDLLFLGSCSFVGAELRRVSAWRALPHQSDHFVLRAPDEGQFEIEEAHRSMAALPGLEGLQLVESRGRTYVECGRGESAPTQVDTRKTNPMNSTEVTASAGRGATLFDLT
ncbi:pentapeptide repeat-containing protein [Pseudoclavibacter sp. RFBG4]|uniref:pentapeptide repeat-containing protein n=1 Tax=Pseudoclavibacter sp. RFBG4 TaxID=2080575 RepID=UPI0015E378A9|nr:pentapeptide repeat-containing protein [Pseudoclavibacter sp. RFBG4]